MSRRKPLPWSSWSSLTKTLWLALQVAPSDALAAFGILATGKRVRGWNRLCSLAQVHPRHYSKWSKHDATFYKREFARDAVPLEYLARVKIGEHGDNSLDGVLYDLERLGREWVVFCSDNETFDPELETLLGAALQRFPNAVLLFWDEDWDLPDERLMPWIKPDWSERLYMARNCLIGASAFRIAEARAVLKGNLPVPADRFGLTVLERALCAAGHIPCHVPLVLTRRVRPEQMFEDWLRLARQIWPDWHFERREDGLRFLRVMPPDPKSWPLVSVVVPTRDRADLVRTCLAGLARTDYPGKIEVILVDNGSSESESLAYFGEVETAEIARVLRDDGPFNYSRLNNRAAAAASGEYLCLLNNDVEAIESGWLTAMMRHALMPDVGAVGAQLLYPDGTIQHAGVTIGVGDAAGHIQRGVDPSSPEHASWHAVTREVTAVTGACLLVSKAHFDAVGGLDEDGFAVAFNDVDFCLKLDALGLANIYCAEARLVHAESRSRPRDTRPDQRARFEGELALLQSRWRTPGFSDPRFSPLFSRSSETCLLVPV